jgi:hypothetical protein
MSWLKWIGIAVISLLFLGAALSLQGRWRWERLTGELVSRLEAGQSADVRPPFTESRIAGLPAPVRRFFQVALTEGVPDVAAVTIQHAGTFNMSEAGEQWKPFTSKQRIVTQRPGFVWDGRISTMPGVGAYVHDAYIAGEGILHPAIAGLVSLADLRGGDDLNQGELMRYLAEAAWYPTALLPSESVSWTALDDRRARATLVDGPMTLALDFTFSKDGLIESVRTDARGRTVAGKVAPTPWEGRWSDYRTVDGMRVPMRGEVAWLLPEGRKPYWRGEITGLKYEFAK